MKKVVFFIVALVAAGYLSYSLVFYNGVYLPVLRGGTETLFTAEGDRIERLSRDGRRDEFVIRGVNVDNFIPGHLPSEHAVPEETWLRWFSQISDMGANAIRVGSIYNDVFYNALYRYNSESDAPLYLLQGIEVTEYANNNAADAYGKEFYRTLYREGAMAVDVIHGRRNIAGNTVRGSGVYRKDLSPWVIGYLVGSEWNAGTVAYTNHNDHPTSYEGKYLSTAADADAFETMLCRVMDHMVAYEANKYRESRLIGFINDPLCDPFEYAEGYDLLYGKFASIDVENIVERDYNGLYAAYSAYALCENFDAALSDGTKAKLADCDLSDGAGRYLHGYLELLNAYHTHPVLVASFEASSARGVTQADAPLDEYAQGETLVSSYHSIRAAGSCGAFIEGWQDSWTRRSYNTSFALEFSQAQSWTDPQTSAQAKGLLAFVPDNPRGNVLIDGDFSDFGGAMPLFAGGAPGYADLTALLGDRSGVAGAVVPVVGEDLRVLCSWDTTYLYFCIRGKKDFSSSVTYLAFDITPKSGSATFSEGGLRFDAPADFVLVIDGEENTRLMVQERYDALRENYLEVLTGEDPYVSPPAKDADRFVTVGMLRQTEGVLKDVKNEEDVQLQLEKIRFARFASGCLHYGNGDPKSPEFNSLADFCFGKNGVELRIPWTLLNFSDPSACLVHDDYYEHYGRENLAVRTISVGVGDAAHTQVSLRPVALSPWSTNFTYTERLKASYEVVRRDWRREA